MKVRFVISFLKTCLLAAFILFISPVLYAQNCISPPAPELIENGNFNDGLGPATTKYKASGNLVQDGTYNINTNIPQVKPDFYGTGHIDSGNFMLVNGAGIPNVVVWQTQVNNIVPGTNYYLSAWVCTLSPLSANGKMAQLQFYIDGQPLGNIFIAPDNYNIWQQFYVPWVSGVNTSAIISVVNKYSSAGGNDFGLDDLSFKASCEGLVGTGPKPDLGPDINSCDANLNINLVSGISDLTNLSFTWSTGSSDPTLTITQPGQYILCVDSSSLGCYKSDTITVLAFPVSGPVIKDTFACQSSPSVDLGQSGIADLFWYDQPTGGTGSSVAPVVATDQPASLDFYASIHSATCESARTKVNVQIHALPVSSLPAQFSFCSETLTEIGQDNTAGYLYSWYPETGLQSPESSRSIISLKNTSATPFDSLYSVLITDSQYSCSVKDSTRITVFPLPDLTLDIIPPLCINSPDVVLNGIPGGGSLKGQHVNGNYFSPKEAGAFLIVYTFTNQYSCSDSAVQTVQVLPIPNINFQSPPVVCENSPKVTLTASPAGGIFSGTGVSGNNFDPLQAGTYQIMYAYKDENSCTDSSIQKLIVLPSPHVSFQTVSAVCANSPDVLLSATPSGGNFSGIHTTGNFFTPKNEGSFPVSYSYKNTEGCTDSAVQTITVYPVPVINFEKLPITCEGSPIVTLVANPQGGIFAGDEVSRNAFNPIKEGTYPVTYTYKDLNGCSDSSSQQVIVMPSPDVSFQAVSPVCAHSPDILLNASPSGGIFKGAYISGNYFSPNAEGAYTITYSFINTEGCADSASQMLTVRAFPLINFEKPPDVCSGSKPINLTTYPQGGIFTGAQINGNVFTPITAGTYTLIYTYLDPNGCSDSVTQQLTVFPSPQLNFEPIPASCIHSDSIKLKASPEGGSFLGNYVIKNLFVPEESGSFRIAYVYMNANSCADTAWQSAIVKPLKIIPVDLGPDLKICSGEDVNISANAGKVFKWLPGGESGPVLKLSPKASAMYIVIATDSSDCATGTDSVFVDVILPPVNVLPLDSIVFCSDTGTYQVAARDGSSFLWQPGGETSRVIDISAPGVYYVTASNENICFTKDSLLVIEACPPTVYIPQAFSPNNDGNNDELKVFGRFYKNLNFKIFNRWGEIIFEANDSGKVWNGTFRGEPMPDGVYPWVVNYEAADSYRTLSNKGSLILVR